MTLVFLAGLLSIVVQVVLLRELSAAFYGVDLIYLLSLGAWLLWTATGAMLARRSLQPSAGRVGVVLIAVGLVVPLDVALIRGLRLLLGGTPGAFLPLPAQIASSAACLVVPSVLLGLLFQWTAKRYLSDSRPGLRRPSLAKAYAVESLGGVVGGLAATVTLHWGVQNLALAFAVSALAFAAALTGIFREKYLPTLLRGTPGFISAAAVGGLLACAVAGWHARALDLWMTSWNHPDVVETADTPYGRITIASNAGQVTAYENDALVLDSESTDPEDLAHLGLLQHASPRRVLLLSGAANGLVAAVAQHHPDRIDDVDLNERLVDLLRRHVPGASEASRSARIAITFDDPRRAIAAGTGAYDVILIAAAEPSSAQANRLFTREFFDQCAGRLAPAGVLAFRLASIENLWIPPLVARTGSIYAALRQVFADVVVLPGTTNVVLASRVPLTRDPDVLSERLVARGIRARLVKPRYLRYLYSNDRYSEIEALLRHTPSPPNTDSNAACYQATSFLWLSKFVPSLGRVPFTRVAGALGWSQPRAGLLLATLVILAVAWRWRGWPRRTLVVAGAGFGGMALETLLLLHYQLKHGIMFQDLGVLLMSAMAGLAAGAWAVDRESGRRGPARMRVVPLLALGLVGLATSFAIRTGRASGLIAVALMLLVTGALVAAVFAFASSREDVDQRRLVSPLYAADVLGGAIGSVAASLVLVPLLGLPLTAEWTAVVMAVAMVLA